MWEDACRIQSRSEKYGCSRGCGPKATPVGDFLHPRQRRSPFIYIRFLHLSLSISHFGPDAEVICVYAFYYARRDVISDILAPAAADSGVREKDEQFVDVMLAACTFELLRVH